ncbi:dimethlysulfonioproprionate lyase DddL [Stappia sp. GBMRC 2046]|uniref:Dimethlysulfonioproprionate lyase DddL n=1 Tax=Stappia sediminis TaxID=2692190 RepID=A0A7X3LSU6_9HYPH|nr:dimethylsulfonioproprionate lyase family protein [Stappia sediminis]MXN64405.1 dimethlysulfonioproprionate lyase DddL [Stappia sediminis]
MTSIAPVDTAENTQLQTIHLVDCPDWLYLLREFDMLYRHGSAGGSRLIRAHRKRVRDTLSSIIDDNPEVSSRSPVAKPVAAHLPRALDLGEQGAVRGMARALSRVSQDLTWEYGYERVPKALAKKYAYCEILGPRGPVKADRLVLGFVLFAPKTTYPQHSHQDIEESYISVAGAWSENDLAVHAPGSLILNRSGAEHRITTAEMDPCLLAYAWIGPENRLNTPGMKLSSKRKARMSQGI